jgi:NAD+ synthase (glutamine-hydrolysing)
LSDELKNSAYKALSEILKACEKSRALIFIDSPIWHKGKLYSCALALQGGKILGAVPKTALPNYGGFALKILPV